MSEITGCRAGFAAKNPTVQRTENSPQYSSENTQDGALTRLRLCCILGPKMMNNYSKKVLNIIHATHKVTGKLFKHMGCAVELSPSFSKLAVTSNLLN